MLFMVIERFRDTTRVRERFLERGRMIPADVTYHSSWIDPARAWCYQLMEAESADRLDPWVRAWSDLVEFEIIPVETSADFWSRLAR